MINFLSAGIINMRTFDKTALFPNGVGLESISFQDGSFFKALVQGVNTLRTLGSFNPKNIELTGLEKTVKDFTNLSIILGVDQSPEINACVYLPQMDKNHPFIDNDWREWFGSDAIAMVKGAGGVINGYVDLKNAKVGGVFTKVDTKVFLTRGLVKSKNFTDEEVAAILAHEIGHLFTYFEVFGRVARTSNVIAAMCRAVYELESQEARVLAIKEASKDLHFEVADPAQLASLPKGKRVEVCQTVFITQAVAASRSDTGINAYEYRSCEQIADQFALKIGAGRHLASGLDKMYREYGDSSTKSTVMHVIIEACSTVWALIQAIGFAAFFATTPAGMVMLGAGLFVGFSLLLLLVSNPLERIYDKSDQRITLMKRTLTEALKDRNLMEEQKKAILLDIEAIGNIESKLDYKRDLLEFIITTFGPKGRRDLKEEQIQKDIENLLTNDLFTAAAKFSI